MNGGAPVHCVRPLLSEPWILDMDATVKPLYGHQEEAVVGYNPGKPGRPSHSMHCYFIAAIRLIVDIEVRSATGPHRNMRSRGCGRGWSASGERLAEPDPRRLELGNRAHDAGLRTARAMSYLFNLKQTAKVKRALERALSERDWRTAGHGWQGLRAKLQLTGGAGRAEWSSSADSCGKRSLADQPRRTTDGNSARLRRMAELNRAESVRIQRPRGLAR